MSVHLCPEQNRDCGDFPAFWCHSCPQWQTIPIGEWQEAPAGQEEQPVDIDDLAHSALQEALSFGLSHDVFVRFGRAIIAALSAPPQAPAAVQGEVTLRDSIAGVLRFCRDVQAEGTANERAIAQSVARMLSEPPQAAQQAEAAPAQPSATAGEANDAPIVQWAKGLEESRKQAEHAYTISALATTKVGSRDWVFFWDGWRAALAQRNGEPMEQKKENLG